MPHIRVFLQWRQIPNLGRSQIEELTKDLPAICVEATKSSQARHYDPSEIGVTVLEQSGMGVNIRPLDILVMIPGSSHRAENKSAIIDKIVMAIQPRFENLPEGSILVDVALPEMISMVL